MPHPGWPAAVALAFLAAAGTAARPTAPAPRPAPVRLARSPLSARYITHFTFTHEGKRLTGEMNGRWVSWDLRRPDRPPQLGPERGSNDNELFIAPTGRVGIETLPEVIDDLPRRTFIDPETMRPVRRFDPPETQFTVPLYTPCLFSADGRRFVANRRYLPHPDGVEGRDVGLTVWGVKTGKRVATLPSWSSPDWLAVELTAVTISRDGKAVLVRVQAPQIGIDCIGVWEPDTGRCRWSRPAEFVSDSIRWQTRFTADGKRLVIAYPDGAIPTRTRVDLLAGIRHYLGLDRRWVMFHVINATTGEIIREVEGPLAGRPKFIRMLTGAGEWAREVDWPIPRPQCVSPDGRTAAISGTDDSIYLWNLEADRLRGRLAHPGQVAGLVFSPDARTLAVVDQDGGAVLYPIADVMAGAR